jgi:hypothetical protein
MSRLVRVMGWTHIGRGMVPDIGGVMRNYIWEGLVALGQIDICRIVLVVNGKSD